MKRITILGVICCLVGSAAWGQAKVAGDTIRYEVNPQEVCQHNDTPQPS